ncbi:MAG: NADH-quinone oxidoreductase subunit I [Planctomycetota bacterium]
MTDKAEQPEKPGTRKSGIAERVYLPAVMKGLKNTLSHVLRRQPNTMHYPEERRQPYAGYRGEHRLTRDEQGREKCTACMLCATACPAHCIEIVAEEAPWDDREKRPKIFNIDMMRCIYCGLCEWACPCEAIELTPVYNIPSRTRAEKIYTKERLLGN